MNRQEALAISKKELVSVKLSWWADYMYIYYSPGDNAFKSGGNEIIDLNFLLDGEYEIVSNDYKYLGGLFAL